MRRFRSLFIAAVLSSPAIVCAAPAIVAPLNVVVRGPAISCGIEVEGRKVTTDELFEIAKPKAKSGRRAQIDSDMVSILIENFDFCINMQPNRRKVS